MYKVCLKGLSVLHPLLGIASDFMEYDCIMALKLAYAIDNENKL